jgi:hypothetical protein
MTRETELAAALEPFAKLAQEILARQPDAPSDGWVVISTANGGIIDTNHHVLVRDLRRAAAALATQANGYAGDLVSRLIARAVDDEEAGSEPTTANLLREAAAAMTTQAPSVGCVGSARKE